jgi:DNA polymerase III subunit epsilon
MREIILDTETTGLDPGQGHRIVEIGAIELVNHIPSGRRFHVYLDPQRDVPPEAEAVHGLSLAFLRGKPVFPSIADELLGFVGDAALVIHNAGFDLAFLNAELERCSRETFRSERIIDTLQLARQRHPMGPNSLDALCKRYGIDLSRREKHGALLDAELLAEVYIELIGGRQAALLLASAETSAIRPLRGPSPGLPRPRPRPLPSRLTAEEAERHALLVAELGPGAVWLALGLRPERSTADSVACDTLLRSRSDPA